jgi:hypothetical protein
VVFGHEIGNPADILGINAFVKLQGDLFGIYGAYVNFLFVIISDFIRSSVVKNIFLRYIRIETSSTDQ